MVWDQDKLYSLKALDNKWNRAIDLLFAWLKEGHTIEFFVEYTNSFSEDEIKFVEGPRKWMLEEISFWIRMMFIEKGMMCMDPNRMDD